MIWDRVRNEIENINRAQFVFLAATILVVAFYFLTFSSRLSDLHKHWITPDDLDMGYPLLALFLVFSWGRLRRFSLKTPQLFFLFPISLVAIALVLVDWLDIKSAFYLGFMALLLFTYGLFLGWRGMFAVVLPLALLNMVMPYWYLAIEPLQSMTVSAVTLVLEQLSFTAFISGNYITVPTGVIHIAGGCSGLKYLLTGLSLSIIAANWNQKVRAHIVLSIAFAVVCSILANWARVTILVFVGYFEGVDHPLMADHDFLGWVVFVIMLVPWFLFESYLIKKGSAGEETRPEKVIKEDGSFSSLKAHALVGCATMLVLSVPFLFMSLMASHASSASTAVQLPDRIQSYAKFEPLFRAWFPSYAGYQHVDHQSYRSESDRLGEWLDVSLLTYPYAGPAELEGVSNEIFSGEWRVLNDVAWRSEHNSELKLRIAVGQQGRQYRLVYYWFNHMTGMANSDLGSKKESLVSLFNGSSAAQLIAVSVRCPNKCETYEQPDSQMLEFIMGLRSLFVSPLD